MRRLVNLPDPCADSVSCAALPEEAAAADIVYGEEGEAGLPGLPGAAGANGRDAFTLTASAFAMPPSGALASVQVIDNRSFTAGQLVYIASVGYFGLDSLTGTTQLNLRNLGAASALPAGALIGSGLRVTSGGQPGWDTPGNTPKRYAIIAHKEDRGVDGGGMDVQFGSGPSAQGMAVVDHLEKHIDPDNIVTIDADTASFQLPLGSWKVRVRVPCHFCNAFQAYLVERDLGGAGVCFGPNCPPKLAIGNGYAGKDTDGADPQRHAMADALVSVTNPQKALQVWVHQESWSFSRIASIRNRALGVASDFDDGAATPVREIFTVIEIEEL